MKRTVLIAVAVALAGSGAFAQPEGGRRGAEGRGDRQGPPEGRGGARGRPMPPIMTAIDANQDGEISAEEISGASAALKALDRDGDGKLSMEEWRRPSPEAMAAEFVKRLMQSDKDGDGKVSKEEAPERMQRAFDKVDTNADGAVDQAEAEAMAKRFQGGAGGRGRGRGEGEGGVGGERPQRRQRPE
jgi:Ca2+-binding EF-hand superfamily protein